MSDTQRLTLAAIADRDNVQSALYRACRGKRARAEVQQLLATPWQSIEQLQDALSQGQLPVGRFDSFKIYDPKKRVIHAAPLLDRVAHHALMNQMETRLERALLPSVFACRVGKGVHVAVHYAQRQARRHSWVMQTDVRHYFPAIRHDILHTQLRRRFRGDGLRLVSSVLNAYQPTNGSAGCGLPIGALTSQHFANHYLNDIDRWCLAQPGVQAHCRYMDDTLLWADDRQSLLQLRDSFHDRLRETVGLTLKPPLIQRTAIGVQFCGIRIRPYRLRASQRRRRRFKAAFIELENDWVNGNSDALATQQSAASALTILLPAQEKAFRRKFFASRPVLEV